MTGFILLPIAAFYLIWLRLRASMDRAEAFIWASLLMSCAVYALTEGPSLLSLLTPWGLRIPWLIIILVLFATQRTKLRFEIPLPKREDTPWFATLVYFLLALTLFIALLAPPNTWDSMIYHLSRVEHWYSNRSLAFYPTNAPHMLSLSPMAEYWILQFHLFTQGSDHFDNLVQWWSYLGSMILAGATIARLRGGVAVQWLGALIIATTPMALLQATSTQNDLAVGFFFLMASYFTLRVYQEGSRTQILGLSLSVGLGIATKGSFYLYAPALCLVFTIALAVQKRWKTLATSALACLALTLVFNLPHWSRNYSTFGHPLGHPELMGSVRNSIHSPGALVSNVIRNLHLHMAVPSKKINTLTSQAVESIHDWIGLSPNDPRTTFLSDYKPPTYPSLSEDGAGNFVALMLFLTSLVLIAKRRVRPYLSFLWFQSEHF